MELVGGEAKKKGIQRKERQKKKKKKMMRDKMQRQNKRERERREEKKEREGKGKEKKDGRKGPVASSMRQDDRERERERLGLYAFGCSFFSTPGGHSASSAITRREGEEAHVSSV